MAMDGSDSDPRALDMGVDGQRPAALDTGAVPPHVAMLLMLLCAAAVGLFHQHLEPARLRGVYCAIAQRLGGGGGGRRKHDEASGEEEEGAFGPAGAARMGYLVWAASVGASVTVRLWCSVHLTAGCEGASPLVASCFVTCCSILLSAVCLAPFSSWQAMPRGLAPWLAGVCAIPAASLIMASQVLGLGAVQMLLKLAMLTTALVLDAVGGGLREGLRQRVLGAGLVFLGVAAGLSSPAGTGAGHGPGAAFRQTPMSVAVFCVAGTLASGAGYVLQARLSTPTSGSAGAAAAVPRDKAVLPGEAAASSALACQLTSALLQVALLAALLASEPDTRAGSGAEGLRMRPRDAHLWLYAGLQGAFYFRSLQALPVRFGYAATFSVSLCGQLLTAAMLDGISGRPMGLGRSLGLSLVVFGATVSALSASSAGGSGAGEKEEEEEDAGSGGACGCDIEGIPEKGRRPVPHQATYSATL